MDSMRVQFLALLFMRTLSGQSLLPDSYLGEVKAAGPTVISRVGVSLRPFSEAIRVDTQQPGLTLDDAMVEWVNMQPVNKQDRLRLAFWARKTFPQDRYNLRAGVSLQAANQPALLDTVFPINSDVWTFYSFDAVADANFATGELRLRFRHGLGPQTYELGGLEWNNLGPAPALAVTGERVEPVGDFGKFNAYFDSAVGGGSAVVARATGPGFHEAVRITTRGASAAVFGAALSWNIERALSRNDVMHLTFYARRLEGALPFIQAQAVVERNSGDFSKSLSLQLPADSSEWRLFQVAFKMDNNYTPGTVAFRFQFGAGPQVFELGGITLLHYGSRATVDQLPSNFTYPGRGDLNAAWRLRALASIEANRKMPVTVLVTNAAGEPVTDAQVTVQQLDHKFRIGSAVAAEGLMATGFDAEQYRSRISSHFNTSVFENDLKWPLFECTNCRPGFFKEQTRAAIDWLTQRTIGVRGHVLIWPSFRNMPSGLDGLTAEALRARIDERFRSVLQDDGIRGKLYNWDVIYEPFDNNDVQGKLSGVAGVTPSNGILGSREAIRWFEMARELEPGARLFLNDYDQFETGNPDAPHTNYSFAFLKYLLDNGAPVGGYGFQSHFGSPQSMDIVESVVDRYARTFPVDFAVSEFDINTPDERMQADYTREFATYIFSHPHFHDFLMWGFWERRHWLPAAAMYRSDWSSKPNAIAWNNLWFKEWWSNIEGRTDADGIFNGRVFMGSYQVTVRVGAQVKTIVEPVTHERFIRVVAQ